MGDEDEQTNKEDSALTSLAAAHPFIQHAKHFLCLYSDMVTFPSAAARGFLSLISYGVWAGKFVLLDHAAHFPASPRRNIFLAAATISSCAFLKRAARRASTFLSRHEGENNVVLARALYKHNA